MPINRGFTTIKTCNSFTFVFIDLTFTFCCIGFLSVISLVEQLGSVLCLNFFLDYAQEPYHKQLMHEAVILRYMCNVLLYYQFTVVLMFSFSFNYYDQKINHSSYNKIN